MLVKKKLFISVATQWTVRNLIVTKVLNEVSKKFDIILFINSSLLLEENIPLFSDFECVAVDGFPETRLKKFFRHLKKALVFKGGKVMTEMIWEKYSTRPYYQIIGSRLIRILLVFINYKWLFNQIDKIEWKVCKDRRFEHHFNDYKPEYLMVSLLNTPLDESLIYNAYKTNTEIRYLLLSWDHLTTKVVMNNLFSKIYLWTQINSNELIDLYDHYTFENMFVVGPPQFGVYNEDSELTRSDFFDYLNIKNPKKIIYYTL